MSGVDSCDVVCGVDMRARMRLPDAVMRLDMRGYASVCRALTTAAARARIDSMHLDLLRAHAVGYAR